MFLALSEIVFSLFLFQRASWQASICALRFPGIQIRNLKETNLRKPPQKYCILCGLALPLFCSYRDCWFTGVCMLWERQQEVRELSPNHLLCEWEGKWKKLFIISWTSWVRSIQSRTSVDSFSMQSSFQHLSLPIPQFKHCLDLHQVLLDKVMGKKVSKIPSKERNCLTNKWLCGFPDVISKLLGSYCPLHVVELSLKPETKTWL